MSALKKSEDCAMAISLAFTRISVSSSIDFSLTLKLSRAKSAFFKYWTLSLVEDVRAMASTLEIGLSEGRVICLRVEPLSCRSSTFAFVLLRAYFKEADELFSETLVIFYSYLLAL